MKRICFIVYLFCLAQITYSQEAVYPNNQTYTYEQLVNIYRQFDAESNYCKLINLGTSDIGKPQQMLIIDKGESFDPKKSRENGKGVLLINNGIHAGESCGIDASVEFIKQILNPKNDLSKVLDNLVILVIPAYNLGGVLNRGKYSRANQVGPAEHGFRGNAKNLDLNRDFIKCDSRNAKLFNQMYSEWNPDVFVETHTTNGSDHQYTLTLISSQKDKLAPSLAKYQEENFVPQLFTEMKAANKEMIPYIYSMGKDPKDGIKAFLEGPRFSSGYAALHHSLAFITEAHVFKPYPARVEHTLEFLKILAKQSSNNLKQIQSTREAALRETLESKVQSINWELDTSRFRSLFFKGYEKVKRKSELTGLEMEFYNPENPYADSIKYYDSYKSKISIDKADYYIVPQAYTKVIDRLKWNKVQMRELQTDTSIEVEYYTILEYETTSKAYEGHYLHSEIKVDKGVDTIQFYKGDFLISTKQNAVNYLVHVLEPQSLDGFFAWNFFDGILQQKEWFSDYAFEPIALELVKQKPDIKRALDEAKAEDESLTKNNFAQLYFIYKLSPYYEPTVNRYPIFRITSK